MVSRAYIIALILICLFPLIVNAQDASALLSKYGMVSTESSEVEGKRLSDLESKYYDISSKVNGNAMVEAATSISEREFVKSISEMDKKIYDLQNTLNSLTSEMENSREATVDILLTLDIKYKVSQKSMTELVNKRNLFTSQRSNTYQSSQTTEEDKLLLASMKKKVTQQKDVYEESTTYPELGEVSNVKHPLNNDFVMTSPYGWRLDPIGKSEMTFHSGMDMQASMRTSVLSIFNGTVETVGQDTIIGNYVIVNHGKDIKSLYGHLVEATIKEGQQVNQYQVIAKSGNTGSRTTGPHLHFSLYIGGKTVDPGILINK